MLEAKQYVHKLDLKADNPEDRLLAAAIHVFSEKGYYESSVDDIVSEAKASKTTFYKYFQNKEDMLIQVFQRLASLMGERVEKALLHTPKNAARTFAGIRAYLETCFEYRELARLLLIDTVGVSRRLEQVRREAHTYFASIFFEELQKGLKGGFVTSEEARIVSRAMVGAVNEVVLTVIDKQQEPNIHNLTEVLSSMLTRYLKNIPHNEIGGSL
ncbi:TetR/AcrR family transcriptional regulator [Aneurinibacillus tyrosinisolvens]|uniref:TetR/AcrR family transcriptional regulator n=1 Tax=Aneurinibacillus tyrosinisolvens TaxID=1443435 RepID=UPI00063FD347|nr:TetR/AcrR family transcriptional regulator [Aneurinibacillus tyrosinisolvens]